MYSHCDWEGAITVGDPSARGDGGGAGKEHHYSQSVGGRQIAQWGRDEEADAMAEVKKQAFLHAKRFYELSLTSAK